MKRSVCVYFTKTELEVLSSEIIAGTCERDSENILVHQGPAAAHRLCPDTFSGSYHFASEKRPGKVREKAAIRDNLRQVAHALQQGDGEIAALRIHLPRLSASRSNYAIHFFSRAFPGAIIDICLIPHGLVGVDIVPLTLKYRWRLFRRKWDPVHLFFPELRYTPPDGDLIGGLDGRVSRVYTFEGMPTPYPEAKTVELAGAKDYLARISGKAKNDRAALVIGQPLVKHGRVTREEAERISASVSAWLAEQGCDQVYYSKHPRSGEYLDFHQPHYQMVEQEGAVEIVLCELRPSVVVSCYSTALVTAKVLLGQNVRAVSFGLDKMEVGGRETLAAYMRSLEVELR